MKHEFTNHQLYPLPTILVGALVDNRPNYLVIGYICPFAFGRYIFFSLYKKRFTREGIHQNGTFSVNVPTEALIEQTYICGSKSGRNIDKTTIFDTFYGELKTAPMIRECPINIECEVTEIIDRGDSEGVIGRVVRSYVDEEALTDGKLDITKVNPLLWSSGASKYLYYKLGEPVKYPAE